jgi:Ni,Fe-hydrogenase III small subunit/Pyruvate/2-oxoacid:ferredoxin oxidoreductase delta subunit
MLYAHAVLYFYETIMIHSLLARYHQGSHTIGYPQEKAPKMPARYRGRPVVDPLRCNGGECSLCIDCCPAAALCKDAKTEIPCLDMGRCLFCDACSKQCPEGAITFSRDFRLAAGCRSDLLLAEAEPPVDIRLDQIRRRLFHRSLKLRQVSAGGCNACEADINVLGTIVYDLGRFGIQFVASPRHADGILVTGPVSINMKEALLATYRAIPEPRVVIATGACAVSGGLFREHPATSAGLDQILPVDLYIPGCPPHPMTILEGLLQLVGLAPRITG